MQIFGGPGEVYGGQDFFSSILSEHRASDSRPFGPELGPIVMNLVVAEISRVKHVEFSGNAAGGSAHV